MELTFKPAEPNNSKALTHLALSAKSHWQYPKEWIEFWKDDLTTTPEFINNNHVVTATYKGEIIGFYSLTFGESDFAYMGNLWVKPDLIGHKLGRKLFDQAVIDCKKYKTRGIELDADPNAQGFYEHMGMIKYDEIHSSVLDHQRVLPKMRLNF